MTRTPTLLAVDGNSLAHRAYHAYEKAGLTDSKGRAVWATYGFLALLGGICDKVSPDGIVVGFDDHTRSVRKERLPSYKAQREAKAPELYQQIEDIKDVLVELGVKVVVPPGLEADDIVGSAAAAAEAAGWRCVIATSDRDSFALINEKTTVLRLVSGLDNAIWADTQYLVTRYGVRPDQYVEYAALRGDVSDNLPGVKGVGEKTAAKLLAGVDGLLANLSDLELLTKVVGKSAAAKLVTDEARVNVVRNLDIMAIVRTVPVDVEACRLAVEQETLRSVLAARELPKLFTRLAVALCGAPSGAGFGEAPYTGEPPAEETEQLSMFDEAPGPARAGIPSQSAPAETEGKGSRSARADRPRTLSEAPFGSDRPVPTRWPVCLP